MGLFTKTNKSKINPTKEEVPTVSPSDQTQKLEIEVDIKNPLGGIAWYQKNYYLAMKFSFMLGVCLLVSIMFSVFLYLTRPTPIYYAVTPDLRMSELTPLNQPVLTEQGLINWTTNLVTTSISLDFLDWREKLQAVRPNYSEEAFVSFTRSMASAGILDMIQKKRLNLSTVVKQAPVITNSGMIDNALAWKIEFPVLLSYESSDGVELTQELLAEVIVSRASTITTPRGVIIKQLVLKRG